MTLTQCPCCQAVLEVRTRSTGAGAFSVTLVAKDHRPMGVDRGSGTG